ncbi:hypothetical protein VUR80DRAFT_806 [Thermomyces stellatus]
MPWNTMGIPILRTPVSVFEVLWGVAVAYFVVRAALIYTAGAIATAFLTRLLVLAASRLLGLRIAASPGLLVSLIHFMFLAVLARWVIVACEVPRSVVPRLAVGAVTYGLLQLVNAVVGFGPFGDGDGIWGTVNESTAGAVQASFVAISLRLAAVTTCKRDAVGEMRGGEISENQRGRDGIAMEEPQGKGISEDRRPGETSLTEELKDKDVAENKPVNQERPARELECAPFGENERWLLSGL